MNYHNILIVTSMIDPPKLPLCYSKIRSVYTREDRYEQTINSLVSAQKIPDVYIVLIECGTFSENEQSELEKHCNQFINLIDEQQVVNAVHHQNKSFGECMQIMEGIKRIPCDILSNAMNFFKLSGRYYLTDKFNYEDFDNSSCVVKPIDNKKDNINTVLYKIPTQNCHEYVQYLNTHTHLFAKNVGFERAIVGYLKNLPNVVYMDTVNAEGRVSVNGELWSG